MGFPIFSHMPYQNVPRFTILSLSLSAYKVVAGSSLLVFLCFHTCLITASRVLHYTLSADEGLVCVAGTSVDSARIMRKERRKEPRRLRKHARHEQRRI